MGESRLKFRERPADGRMRHDDVEAAGETVTASAFVSVRIMTTGDFKHRPRVPRWASSVFFFNLKAKISRGSQLLNHLRLRKYRLPFFFLFFQENRNGELQKHPRERHLIYLLMWFRI